MGNSKTIHEKATIDKVSPGDTAFISAAHPKGTAREGS